MEIACGMVTLCTSVFETFTSCAVRTLLSSDVYFTLIYRDIVAFGHVADLQRVLNAADAGAALAGIVPGAADALNLTGRIDGLTISVKASSGITLDLAAQADSTGDASLIVQLAQAGLAVKRLQGSTEGNRALGNLLNTMSISTKGSLVDVSVVLSDEQMVNLTTHNAFVP